MTIEKLGIESESEVPERLRAKAAEQGWPEGLLERALELRVNQSLIEFYLDDERVDAQTVEQVLRQRERVILGTMRIREASWEDSEQLADLHANSAEEIGDWLVTVERSPFPFAQYRLQEHPSVHVLEDQGQLLATASHSVRNTVVRGERLSVHFASALRVRNDRRGTGLGRLISWAEPPEWAWWGVGTYWYARAGNIKALDIIYDRESGPEETMPDDEVPGLPVTVHYLTSEPFAGDSSGIRGVTAADLGACCNLINRTHGGLDLFRPYTEEFLETRLDDSFWGPKPAFWTHVYGWDDYVVLEEGGRLVACAGLWDRGRDLREVWLNKNGERRVIDPAALLDFGYAEGREDAMAHLLAYLLGCAHDLGRQQLMAPLEYLPELLALVEPYAPRSETRGLEWRVSLQSGALKELQPERPYTDLAYW